jgi:hypothetical protein
MISAASPIKEQPDLEQYLLCKALAIKREHYRGQIRKGLITQQMSQTRLRLIQ